MPDKKAPESPEKVNEKLDKEEPGLTTPPPQLTLNEEPIPDPNLNIDNGKKQH